MARRWILGGTIVLLVGLLCVPGFSKGKQGPAGKSNVSHLDLATVSETPAGYEMAWGKVKYNLSGPTLDFVLNAHRLVPYEEYVIKSGGVTLGGGTADMEGNLHVQGSPDGEGISPAAKFNVRRASDNARILQSAAHGYEFEPPAP